MRILVTNDDGIHAPGLGALEAIAHALTDDVWVVAPETDNSGVSHSLSLNDPLRLRRVDDRHYAVRGTPTDCVIMAVRHIMKDDMPDLVLSGVNRGQNVAEDVHYSGTVAGAIEGAMLGIPSLALSQCYGFETRENPRYDTAEALGPDIIRKLIARELPPGVININFPNVAPDDVKGVKVAAQGRRDQALLDVDGRMDGRGNPYFWLAFQRPTYEPQEGTDLWAVRNGYVSVTPLLLNLTDNALADDISDLFD